MMLRGRDIVTVWTIGHSTLSLDAFLARLTGHAIAGVADVRRFPGSRRHPQFNREALAAALPSSGIRYESLPELGGRRAPRPDSENAGWRHPAFRGYADYMGTGEFEEGVGRLLVLAREVRVAIMCAEAQWVQCHRRLIADYLTAGGHTVFHIGSHGAPVLHRVTAPGVLIAGRLAYPGDLSLDL